MIVNKCEKLVCNSKKRQYVVRIRTLKQSLTHILVMQKVHRVIKFNQKSWLKQYVEKNINLRKMTLKNIFTSL